MPHNLSDSDFKAVIGEFISKMGFTVENAEKISEGSFDFKALTKNPMGGNVVSLIRASAYTKMVGGDDINDLYRKMADIGAVRAAYITTSSFSENAIEQAREKPISLINKYQLIDSIEKRGLLEDSGLMRSLESYGMGERHFQGREQSFVRSMRSDEVRGLFQAKAGKHEKVSRPKLRYAPVEVFKAVTHRDLNTLDDTIRHIETKDYIFVNLNNLDLYYIQNKRKLSGIERLLMRSDIIAKIHYLPPNPKENLFHLLQHGDMPFDTLSDKDLAILENKKVIDVYEGKRHSGELVEYLQMALDGILETVNMVVNEITTGIGSMGEGSTTERPEKPVEKKVAAQVTMPHLYGGIYDLWKYLKSMNGVVSTAEIDPMRFNSKEVGELLGWILNTQMSAQGIIFMPYYRTKYIDSKTNAVTKYEILYTPQFKDPKKMATVEAEEKEKPKKRTTPKVKGRKPTPSEKFRLIR